MALRRKQHAFVEEYLKCWNAAEAARKAGYSERTARSIGSENLTKPDIQEAISKRLDELKMSADEVLIRLAEQARGEHSKYATPHGTDMIRLIQDGKAHLIKKWIKNDSGISVEFYDSQRALELIGKHHALFKDRVEHEGEISIEIEYVNDPLAAASLSPGTGKDREEP